MKPSLRRQYLNLDWKDEKELVICGFEYDYELDKWVSLNVTMFQAERIAVSWRMRRPWNL